MIRKAFTMEVYPERLDEYRQRHNPIWPELAAVLSGHGVSNYSIHLGGDGRTLFAYAEIEDEERWAAIGETEVCRRWWASMADLMVTGPDDRPVSRELDELFYLP